MSLAEVLSLVDSTQREKRAESLAKMFAIIRKLATGGALSSADSTALAALVTENGRDVVFISKAVAAMKKEIALAAQSAEIESHRQAHQAAEAESCVFNNETAAMVEARQPKAFELYNAVNTAAAAAAAAVRAADQLEWHREDARELLGVPRQGVKSYLIRVAPTATMDERGDVAHGYAPLPGYFPAPGVLTSNAEYVVAGQYDLYHVVFIICPGQDRKEFEQFCADVKKAYINKPQFAPEFELFEGEK